MTLYLRASLKLLPLKKSRSHAAHIQILIKTWTYRVLRRWPRKYARRLSRTNRGIFNVHLPPYADVVVIVVVEGPRGWSAVSSSLEPSPPTGHYCLVPYSVTNCFIKLKSHNPHCNASRRPCASTLPSTPLFPASPFSRPLVYTRPHATSGRVLPLVPAVVVLCRIVPLDYPRKFSRASFFQSN